MFYRREAVILMTSGYKKRLFFAHFSQKVLKNSTSG
uniref:Uncharacterized protein n=1 Tax=Erwinia amylovora ATCC BAA-2158 TaxID=889211 RepID=E5B0W1_ERWAM|nr:hypothetical protein predicted by Glimmer/Critica [Erwinia amylovora ATCC BAA-2158]